jgi:hypothetical protein
MKAKDIKPGVVYGINSSKSYGTANPIVFLAPVDRDHLYQTTSRHSPEGTPSHVKARAGAKPGRGSMFSSPTIGYPAVVGRGDHTLDRLKTVTLADFEAATSTHSSDDWWFTLVTVLGHIQGPYEEVRAAEEAQRRARIEAQQADEQARERAVARFDGLAATLAKYGVTVSPDERYHPTRLLIDFDEADKLLALLASSEEG